MKRLFNIWSILLLISFFSCSTSLRKKENSKKEIAWVDSVDVYTYSKCKYLLAKYPQYDRFCSLLDDFLEFQETLQFNERYGVYCLKNCLEIEFTGEANNLWLGGVRIDVDSLSSVVFEILTRDTNMYEPVDKINVIDSKGIERQMSKGNFKLYFAPEHRNTIPVIYIEISEGLHKYNDYLINQWSKNTEINETDSNLIDSLIFRKFSVYEEYLGE